ncbi:type VII secretion target [Mesobacillus campisalis]|uniref:type VII secretion target n=1 Tax=Mesobacillus campisalis TaxID=1408103 RepID=UPI00069A6EA1|nr:hypothetical protein [Mesobacillus campisalis]
MSRIHIKPALVRSANSHIKQEAGKLTSVASQTVSLKNAVSGTIQSRHNIGIRMSRAVHSMDQLQTKVNQLHQFIDLAMNKYTTADEHLNRRAHDLVAKWNSAGVQQPGNGKKGNEELSSPDRPSKNDSGSLYGIFKYFHQINEQISGFDKALIASQAASVATALMMTRKLGINYIGGKPNWWNRIKGGYKFSVSAHSSWTSRGGYSSKTARFLYNAARSQTTNPVGKAVRNFVASYTNPAAVLKHAAGFPKNATTMKGTTLAGSFQKRITMGAKEVTSTVAEAKGFTKVGRGIPIIGGVITAGAGVAEYADPKNAHLSRPERFGRATGGVVADVAAIGAGAKAGALIGGAIGGPIGVVVGGAAGGLAGAVFSSQIGDAAKDLGGKIGKGIESGFKSVKSWFN